MRKLNKMKKDKYVFLPVENTARELDYKLNLVRHFCSKGYRCIIGFPPHLRDLLKYIPYKAMFLEKGFNPDPQFYAMLKAKGVFTYDLHDENASKDLFSLYKYQNDDDVKKATESIEAIFFWGSLQKKFLDDLLVDKQLLEKVYVMGYPSMDLNSPLYKQYYKSIAPKALPESYVLVNTNFAFYNGFTIEEHLEAAHNIPQEDIDMAERRYIIEEKIFQEFRASLVNLISKFPNETFLIRPHPLERCDRYRELFSKYENVIISKEGNVNQVISKAKVVIHKDCTTALQSYLMGVPVISLTGKKFENEVEAWTLSFSDCPITMEEEVSALKRVLNENPAKCMIVRKEAEKVISSLFDSIGNSTQKIVEFMHVDFQKKFNDEVYTLLKDNRPFTLIFKSWVRKFLPLHYSSNSVDKECSKVVRKSEVMKKLNLFESVDPLKVNLSVKKIFPSTFEIYNSTQK